MSNLKTNIKRASLLSLGAIALILAAPAADAQAGVRIQARLHTSLGTVRVVSGPSIRQRHVVRQPLPVRRCLEVRITAQDKRIARRLARYTGVRKQELLNLKRQGYSWTEIGRWLDLSPRAVRAAYSQRAWRNFLDRGHPGHGCEIACNTHHRGRGRH